MNPLFDLLNQHRELFIDRVVVALRTTIPSYSRLDLPAIRASVAGFLADTLNSLGDGGDEKVTARMVGTSADRIAQGFPLSDYLHALLMVSPVTRQLVREVGPKNQPGYAQAFAELEAKLQIHISRAASLYSEAMQRKLESKNLELNRLNQQLQIQARTLNTEHEHVARELEKANEFNQRVLESLSSGVLVFSPTDARITLFTERMAEILDLPAEEALGRTGPEALAAYSGLDHQLITQTVRTAGRFPLTKLTVTRADGLRRIIFAQAQRLYGRDGEVEGTVFVVDDVSERERLIESFSRYVSRDLLTRLLSRPEAMRLEGEKRVCTVLFADIRGFTRIAESMAPEALHRLLNAFLHVMIAAIFENDGFIDKFVGDKVMALFTTPLTDAAAAQAAVRAGIAVQRGIDELNRLREQAGEARIEVGVGINTGEVMIGNVGDDARMDFTAIGDAVNVADRLQSIALGGETLIGARTAELLAGAMALDDRGEQRVKGREGAVRTFAVRRSGA